jgi:hypothetical protein
VDGLDGAEAKRPDEANRHGVPWRGWGPYLRERQPGTVREDYKAAGDAWSFLPHDHARSPAYRWGEDGIAGISGDKQRLCLSLALWNGRGCSGRIVEAGPGAYAVLEGRVVRARRRRDDQLRAVRSLES